MLLAIFPHHISVFLCFSEALLVCSELLVSECLGLNLLESADLLFELVIPVEGPLLNLLPLTGILELSDLINVVVLG
jgi:hypothetical protein